jgi:hypothetical protein
MKLNLIKIMNDLIIYDNVNNNDTCFLTLDENMDKNNNNLLLKVQRHKDMKINYILI